MNERNNQPLYLLIAYMSSEIVFSLIYQVLNALQRYGSLRISSGPDELNYYDIVFIFNSLIDFLLVILMIALIKGIGYRIIFACFLLIKIILFGVNLYMRISN